MSLLYLFKRQKDRALLSVSQALLIAGVTPNMITAAGLIVSLVAGLVAMSGRILVGVSIFVVGALLDGFDGSFARTCGLATDFGKYFDSSCDRLSELAIVTGAVIGGVSFSAYIVVAGSMLLMASRVFNHRKGLSSDAALFGRPERIVLLIAGLLSPAPFNLGLFVVAGSLCVVSSGQVLAYGMAHSHNGKHQSMLVARKLKE